MLIKILSFIMFSILATSAQGQIILITGASGDIGLALTKHFIEKKDIVLAHYFNNQVELENLKKKYPEQIHLIQADFNTPEKIDEFWNAVLKTNKPINTLINSAGIEQEDVSLDQIRKTMNINYFSPRLVSDYAIDHFINSKKAGTIINIGSRAAYRGLPKGYYTYADSKAALTKYSQDIARENAKNKISVYVVAPGPVEGKMFNNLKKDVREQCLASMPTGKPVAVKEVVAIIDLLVSGNVPSSTGGVFDLMGSSWSH